MTNEKDGMKILQNAMEFVKRGKELDFSIKELEIENEKDEDDDEDSSLPIEVKMSIDKNKKFTFLSMGLLQN
jgi:hypothetical protein